MGKSMEFGANSEFELKLHTYSLYDLRQIIKCPLSLVSSPVQ